uniref:BEACH domain-containing protein n=1 Tax=Wuchereria bancrofti TaxID=6293 RepID=A0A1I8ESI3_WUCBA
MAFGKLCSTTDFKELIPEFFCLPDFLTNKENPNLGIRQNGDVVDDVILLKWCRIYCKFLNFCISTMTVRFQKLTSHRDMGKICIWDLNRLSYMFGLLFRSQIEIEKKRRHKKRK